MFLVGGLVGVAFGLYLMFGRFIYKRIRKKQTYYALSNWRVIELITSGGRQLKGISITEMPSIKKLGGSNGVGTILFGKRPWYANDYGNTGMDLFARGQHPALGFYDIHEVDAVYQLLNDLMVEAKPNP